MLAWVDSKEKKEYINLSVCTCILVGIYGIALGVSNMKKTICLPIALFIFLLICISNANASTLPSPVSFNTDVAAPSFTMTAIGGQTLTSSDYGSGNNILMVYGRITCGNTIAFLSGIQEGMDALTSNGIIVLVGLHDNPSDAEMSAFADKYPGIVCAKVSDSYSESGMWTGLNAVGYDTSSGVTFPVVFLRSSDAKLRYYSTGYVNQPLKVVSAAIAMSGGNVPQSPTSGSCGNNASWRYQNGLLTISGTGAIDDYDDSGEDVPWMDYWTDIQAVVIGEGITRIGNNAFTYCGSLTDVSLPKTLRNIGEYAFYGCSSMTSVTIPQGVTSIENGAFEWCCLYDITIPSSVINLGNLVFVGNYLSSINVAAGNNIYSSVDGILFNKAKTNLLVFPQARNGSYTIPSGVETISTGAFSYCFVTEIILPDTVKYIDSFAFWECETLQKITIPKSVMTIGNDVFYACEDLTIYCFENSVAQTYAEDNNNAYILIDPLYAPDILVPSALKTIEAEAFSGIAAKWVKLAEGVKSIGSKAFTDCSNLRGIYIPRSCTSIAADAFSGNAITIYGYKGSYAETYALNQGFNFIDEDGKITYGGNG